MKVFVWPNKEWMLEDDLGNFPSLMDVKNDDYVTVDIPDSIDTRDKIHEYVMKMAI